MKDDNPYIIPIQDMPLIPYEPSVRYHGDPVD